MYIAAVRVSSIVPNKFFCHNILLQLDPSFPSLDTRGTKIRPASSFLYDFCFCQFKVGLFYAFWGCKLSYIFESKLNVK